MPKTHSRSARKRLTKKPKGALSLKAHAKREVSVKSKLLGVYIRRRKQKGTQSLRAIKSLRFIP